MPKEVRYILFSTEETIDALFDHLGQTTWQSPATAAQDPVRLELASAEDGSISGRLIRRTRRPAAEEVTEVAHNDLLAAALSYCKAVRVPMPVYGQKSLELVRGQLALMVMMQVEPKRVEARAGVVRYRDAEADEVRQRGLADSLGNP